MPYGPSSAIGNRRSHSPGMSRRARLLQRCVIRPWLWQCKYPPSMCVRALPAGVMFDPRVLFAVVDGRAPGTPGDYGVGHLLPAHFVVGLARLVCRDVLTFWPEEPKRAPEGSAARATRPRPWSAASVSTAPPSALTFATEASTSSLCQNTDQDGASPGASDSTSSPIPAIGRLFSGSM